MSDCQQTTVYSSRHNMSSYHIMWWLPISLETTVGRAEEVRPLSVADTAAVSWLLSPPVVVCHRW